MQFRGTNSDRLDKVVIEQPCIVEVAMHDEKLDQEGSKPYSLSPSKVETPGAHWFTLRFVPYARINNIVLQASDQ